MFFVVLRFKWKALVAVEGPYKYNYLFATEAPC